MRIASEGTDSGTVEEFSAVAGQPNGFRTPLKLVST